MDFKRIDELERVQDLGRAAPWSVETDLSPEFLEAAMERGRRMRAEAFRDIFGGLARRLARALRRLVRRRVPRVPAGAHGPEAVDFDCAHGRPC